MFEYRITKYNPSFRSPNGDYTKVEWTSKNDIGLFFGGVALTAFDYQRVEDAYAEVAIAFLAEAGVRALRIKDFENHTDINAFNNDDIVSLDQIGVVIRAMLREEIWCKLEGPRAFIHVGYDYYMYVGVPVAVITAQSIASREGLFVEPFQSPYSDPANN